jgi:hypothetical protein
MNSRISFVVAGLVLVAASFAGLSSSRVAAQSSQTWQATIQPSNNSGVRGTATFQLNGNDVTVTVKTTGNSPGLAHAQHIHVGGRNVCPDPSADADKDGYVSATEAMPYAGEMKISLTTQGDVSVGSALAVDRMPVADNNGTVNYQRTFTLPAGVTPDQLVKSTIDIHGISAISGDKAKYDGNKKSDLNAGVPFETTVPSACGVLTGAPVGGVAAGGGSTSGVERKPLIFAGTIALLASILLYAFRREHLRPTL